MARKAVATAETVAQAVEALISEKLDPTVERGAPNSAAAALRRSTGC